MLVKTMDPKFVAGTRRTSLGQSRIRGADNSFETSESQVADGTWRSVSEVMGLSENVPPGGTQRFVFTGPSAYVSATWYSNPQIGSTWNYMSIHIGGTIEFMSDDGLVEFMRKFTLKFEEGNTSSKTIYDNLPDSFLHKMMPAIVGFELKAEQFENVFKLSQNRDEQSYRNIIDRLEERGGESALIAAEMRKRQEELFPPGVEWDGSRFDS